MKKPIGVPKEARWNEEDEEWELGTRNRTGDEIGEWKWWDPDEGYLICHAFFSDDGKQLLSAKRFHPNGELASTIFFNKDRKELATYYTSTEDTYEHFPENPFKNVWKAERVVGVFPKEYNFYDKSGKLLSIEAGRSSELEKLKTAPENETAEQAITRLNKVIAIVKENEDIDEDFLEELADLHQPYQIESVSEEKLAAKEQELGIKFPPSYKEFVLKHGLIQFGKTNDFNRRLFLDYNRLSTELLYWGIDADDDFSKETKSKLDKIITFSFGDEGLQAQWFHCFDYNTLNPETGEVSIMVFDQDDSNTPLENSSDVICEASGFDAHMSAIVDQEIEFIV
ncbi:SMI1/KNR4 family protein [Mesonia aestuariivivens]|uniref:SMI1/KNR4 family protein n=1 Tax=Mesonia aestuariivivens TaxID=2796128 RepID=A0ABS6W0B6_9FLAO|nr:SMI1/KNR4 family protein [Mesonia aestuariivivens]MBW2960569.1 SMI1/KNR4 family protein [Mesonia aestuariivivens]